MQVKRIAECSLEHSAILSTFIKLPFVIKIFVLSIFKWPFYMRGSRNFRQGGGGRGPGQSDKKSSDNVFFSPQLILQKSNGQFQRNILFFKAPEGAQHFPGGGGGWGPIAYSL